MLKDTSRLLLTQQESIICKEKARVAFSEWFSLYELWWPRPVLPEKTGRLSRGGRSCGGMAASASGVGRKKWLRLFPRPSRKVAAMNGKATTEGRGVVHNGDSKQQQERVLVEIKHGSKWGHGPRASELAHLLQMGRGLKTHSSNSLRMFRIFKTSKIVKISKMFEISLRMFKISEAPPRIRIVQSPQPTAFEVFVGGVQVGVSKSFLPEISSEMSWGLLQAGDRHLPLLGGCGGGGGARQQVFCCWPISLG